MFKTVQLKILLVLCLLLFFSIFIFRNYALSAGTYTTTTIDSTGNVGQFISLGLGSDGFARISYYDNTNANLKFSQCTNTDCSAKNIATLDSTGDVGRHSSLGLGSDGFARISYYDSTNQDLKFVQCTNADCSTNNITTIDSTGNVGQYTSLALGSDGFARISYHDDNGGDENLKFVQCTNADCSTKNITTIDSVGVVGQYISLALGSDGFARISYHDATNSNLKFVQCTNAACSTKNISTVDSVGTVGEFTSLDLGSDGFARISYFDRTNGALKFAQCTNADCSTSTISTINDPLMGNAGKDPSLVLNSSDKAFISYHRGTGGGEGSTTGGRLELAEFVGGGSGIGCTNTDWSCTIIDTPGGGGSFKGSSIKLSSAELVRIAYLTHLTDGDLKYAVQEPDATPSPTTAPSSGSSSSPSDSGTGSACNDSKPVNIPNLFQIDAGGSYVNLYFAKANGDVDGYIIEYGLTPAANQFADVFDYTGPLWVIGRNISFLSPNTTYYFRIRAKHGCNAGDWSNVRKAKTKARFSKVYQFFANLVGFTPPSK